MQIQANSCAEREMEPGEHPWFTAQKGSVQLKPSWCLWAPVNPQLSNNCSACSAWALRLCALGLHGDQERNLNQGHKFMHSAHLLLYGIQDYLSFSGELRIIVPGWLLARLCEQPVMRPFWPCCSWLCIAVTWDFLYCSCGWVFVFWSGWGVWS